DVFPVATRLRVDDFQGAPERILHDGLLPLRARERLVELELEPGETLVVDTRVAEHGGADPLLRIVAPLLVVEPEALDVLVLERLREAGVGLALDVDEATRPVGQQWIDLVRVETQGLLDSQRRRTRILNLARVRVDRRRPGADRQLHPEAVVDRPPVRRNVDRLTVLARRHVPESLRAHRLQPSGAKKRNREDGREDGDQKANAPVRNPRAHRLAPAVLELEV